MYSPFTQTKWFRLPFTTAPLPVSLVFVVKEQLNDDCQTFICDHLRLYCPYLGCGCMQRRSHTAQPEPTSEAAAGDLTTYVGDVDGNLFITLDVIELNGAQEERAIRAYLCDGADVAVWLTGQFSGDQVTLVSGDTRTFIRIRSCCQRLGSLYDEIRQSARIRVYSRQWEPRKVRLFLHQCAKLAPRFLSCVLAKQLTPTAVSLTPCPALPPRLDTP